MAERCKDSCDSSSADSCEQRRPKRHALCDSVLTYERNSWEFEHVIRNKTGNEIWSIYNDKYFEIWIFYI